MPKSEFVTAINCMDGRVQEPVLRWMTRRLAAVYVDMITEPGPNRILASEPGPQVDSIRNRVLISVKKHGSNAVAIVGHHDCAGNPASDETQFEQVKQSASLLSSWNLGVRVLGLWVNKRWAVEVICDTEETLA